MSREGRSTVGEMESRGHRERLRERSNTYAACDTTLEQNGKGRGPQNMKQSSKKEENV